MNNTLPAILIAIGFAIAGIAISLGIQNFNTADRYVTVKGLAEREVKADTANYYIGFRASGDNMQKMYKKINADAEIVKQFLLANGVVEKELKFNSITARDTFSNGYVNNNMKKEFRYSVAGSFTVKSKFVEKIEKLVSKKGELIGKGINVENDRAEYLFTRINDIKPDMISEAIAAARQSASRFANDSGSELKGIRRANQGTLVIRDQGKDYGDKNSITKKARIVSTVVYNLGD